METLFDRNHQYFLDHVYPIFQKLSMDKQCTIASWVNLKKDEYRLIFELAFQAGWEKSNGMKYDQVFEPGWVKQYWKTEQPLNFNNL